MNLKPLFAAALLAATSAPGQPPVKQPERPRNAAVDNWRAGYMQATHRPAKNGESPLRVDFETLGEVTDPTKMPPEFSEARKAESPDAIKENVLSSTAPTCEFQLDTSKGAYLLLPHLTMICDVVRAAGIEEGGRLLEGKQR